MWWWLVTLALAVLVWGYCLFAVDPAMLPQVQHHRPGEAGVSQRTIKELELTISGPGMVGIWLQVATRPLLRRSRRPSGCPGG